eukprot:CAMPEP_0203889542 /NCGR_PEP_ID=MMETSP0359-20131031/33098_1 /ASSEMBLY_ACC=CAM_ASM_000338 /TAXON_ID=268821 /ORGANISM="Scrippsiella Hangoei, Strain SHTV-5" /LENGTH=191 /DNA_ID=CAMNT_0050810981 /DNA_START=34 /DNA_END=607 /DNA_ORIENTATION=-
MGGAICRSEAIACPCVSATAHEVRYDGKGNSVGPAGVEGVPALSLRHGEGSILEKLQGRWRRQADSQAMGEIKGGQILWDEDYMHPPTRVAQLPSGELEMDLVGKLHYGRAEAARSSGPMEKFGFRRLESETSRTEEMSEGDSPSGGRRLGMGPPFLSGKARASAPPLSRAARASRDAVGGRTMNTLISVA